MIRFVGILIFGLFFLASQAQEVSLKYKGQLSTYGHYNPSNAESLWFGGRYLPQLNLGIDLLNGGLIDFETSANIYGNAAIIPFTDLNTDGEIKPYRAWVRYSTAQLELRAGLQKINFGSANLLRPLMWFDQIDPRDPLKLTDGVWGVLGRYYFLNNANLWLWGLYGNKNPKGLDLIKSNAEIPEFGGRFQMPVPLGEAGLSYHHRYADSRGFSDEFPSFERMEEHRYGFDVRLDWALGTWIEASWVSTNEAVGMFRNQEVLNLGLDYTFGIGRGLYLVFEQLLLAYDERAFAFNDPVPFSLLSASYPIGMFDNVSAIFYYDWSNNNTYNFVNYQKQFSQLSLYVMAYWNPKSFAIPGQGGTTNLFGGKGVQCMLVWNH